MKSQRASFRTYSQDKHRKFPSLSVRPFKISLVLVQRGKGKFPYHRRSQICRKSTTKKKRNVPQKRWHASQQGNVLGTVGNMGLSQEIFKLLCLLRTTVECTKAPLALINRPQPYPPLQRLQPRRREVHHHPCVPRLLLRRNGSVRRRFPPARRRGSSGRAAAGTNTRSAGLRAAKPAVGMGKMPNCAPRTGNCIPLL